MMGQNYKISGTIAPMPKLPDYVLIQVSEQGVPDDLDAETATVQPNGYFYYNATVGPSWTSGTYLITAIDTYGATGNVTIQVGCHY